MESSPSSGPLRDFVVPGGVARALSMALADLVLLVDDENVCVAAHLGLAAPGPYSQKKIIGQRVDDLLPDDAAPVALRQLARVRAGEGVQEFNYHLESDGERRDFEVRAAPVEGHELLVVVIRDASARLVAVRGERESADRFALFMQHLPGLSWIKDSEGRYVFANETTERAYGVAGDQLLGRTDDDVMKPEYAAQCRNSDQRVRFSGGAIQSIEALEWPDGVRHQHLVSKFPIPVEGGLPYIGGVAVDISDQQRAAESLRQSQKLESLGLLASGIAHDFNNLLTSVLGFAQLALDELPVGSTAALAIEEVERAAERAVGLTSQMLAYAGHGKFPVGPIRLDYEVAETARLLESSARASRVTLDLEPASLTGDATQIRQVVLNLLTNAADAIARDGAVVVRTRVITASGDDLRSRYISDELPEGRYALLEVEDNGVGMSEDTLARLFDPFFSTKVDGRGLGLAAVLGIVRSHRGTIQVTSAPGAGSRFRVLLPFAEHALDDPLESDAGRLHEGSGTVLVIDDDEGVRRFVQRALGKAGYVVRVAVDGRDGLEVYERYQPEIVAAVVDVAMPRLDGAGFVRAVRDLGTNLPMLMLSGLADDVVEERLKGLEVHVVAKPVRPDDLTRSIQDLVRRTANPDSKT